MGGAGFPPTSKSVPQWAKQIPLLSMVECEPYITADHRLMLSTARRSSAVFGFILKALSADHAYIGIEDNKMNAVNHLKELVGGASDITVRLCAPGTPGC